MVWLDMTDFDTVKYGWARYGGNLAWTGMRVDWRLRNWYAGSVCMCACAFLVW